MSVIYIIAPTQNKSAVLLNIITQIRIAFYIFVESTGDKIMSCNSLLHLRREIAKKKYTQRQATTF